MSSIDFDRIAESVSPRQLARALGAEKRQGGYRCPFPDHEDGNPSFSIFRDGSRTAAKCHGCGRGGSPVSVASELWGVSTNDAAERLASTLGLHVSGNGNGRSEIVAEYTYLDESGEVLFQAVRMFPKDFRQRRPDGRGGWTWGLGDARRVLYRLPEVIEAVSLGKPIYVAEGEKDVQALEQLGAVATCNPMGALKWRDEYSQCLRGAEVRIVADKDDRGREHAEKVAESLNGIAASVDILEAKVGKDPHDHVAAGLGLEEFQHTRDADRVFATLGELRRNPELLKPPECVVPRLAYRGRLVLLAAPDKSGKSTLAGRAITSLAKRIHFLGEPMGGRFGTSLLLGLEEHVGDEVRRLDGVADDLVRILLYPCADLLSHADALLADWRADLVVIDSLTEYARVTLGEVPSNGDDAGWSGVVRPLAALARKHDCALLVLHHTRRDGKARGASEIFAAVDATLEMEVPDQAGDPTERRITGRGRWPIEPFSFVETEDGIELGSGSRLSLDARILLHVEQEPGLSGAEYARRAGGRKSDALQAIRALESRGAIENRGSEHRTGWHPRSAQTALEGVS